MALVTVTVDGATRHHIVILDGRVVHDEFKEADHPRAANGQFGSGGTVHVVTTAGSGDPEIRTVTDDEDEAAETRAEIEDDEGDDTAEHHEVPFERRHDGSVDAVHVLYSGDGAGGANVHGAYDDAGVARGNAVASSRDAWDAFGPVRGDLDRDEAEEDEAAARWNDAHGGDEDAILAKTDDNGWIERDADGALQWIQDGDDVEPDQDHHDAFDAHFAEMYPLDERAEFPGLDAANEHFAAADDGENVFRLHTQKVG